MANWTYGLALQHDDDALKAPPVLLDGLRVQF